MPRHTFTVLYLADLEEGGFTAEIPALDIVTQGDTLDAAKEMARDAIEVYRAAATKVGRLMPIDAVIVEQVSVAYLQF